MTKSIIFVIMSVHGMNSVLTSLSAIVKFIDIPSIFEKIMLLNTIKEYRSMMCNILNLVI